MKDVVVIPIETKTEGYVGEIIRILKPKAKILEIRQTNKYGLVEQRVRINDYKSE